MGWDPDLLKVRVRCTPCVLRLLRDAMRCAPCVGRAPHMGSGGHTCVSLRLASEVRASERFKQHWKDR